MCAVTFALAGLGIGLILSSSIAHKSDGVFTVAVLLGVPLCSTALGAAGMRRTRFIVTAVALVLIAGALAGMVVAGAEVDGWSGACEFALPNCPRPLSAALVGAVPLGALPSLVYLACARRLRRKPAELAIVYVVTLPAFAVWAVFAIGFASLATSVSSIPAD